MCSSNLLNTPGYFWLFWLRMVNIFLKQWNESDFFFFFLLSIKLYSAAFSDVGSWFSYYDPNIACEWSVPSKHVTVNFYRKP